MKYTILLLVFLAVPFSVPSRPTLGDKGDKDISLLTARIGDTLHQRTRQGFSGSVLIALRDSIILNQGFGFTDSAKSYPVRPRTLFNIASISKSLTAVGILKLAEKGLVNLRDSIGTYFRHVPTDKRSITLHHLLTHTSGLQQHYVASEVSQRAHAVRNILNDTLASLPGAAFEYSNENYELLAAIIEIVSGERYEQYMRKEVLQACGMKDTRFWAEENDLNSQRYAQKQDLSKKARQRNWDYIGSGGIYSTAPDLYNFYTALFKGKLLQAQTRQQMLRAHTRAGERGIGYGYFISSTPWGSTEYWTRGTESWGHNAIIRYFPDEEVVVILCSNSGDFADGMAANKVIANEICSLLFGDRWEKKK